MEKSLNKKFGPVGLSLLWIGLCLIFGLIIPALSAGSSSSSEVPFVLQIYNIIGLVCGTFLISLSNTFFFKEWVRRFWYLNGFITLITGGMIAYYVVKMISL
ncbi:hypothetical protein TH53_18795 [Pedobacter lusitanus]|uniref:Uncharacterized protein n=1 Tax=Pedobacter lusitanus TaxID=1503925 RepID=A0A0D0GMU7_9SPHI|nr:hypothetical protein [Pedobacter lusitanus]KIO75766.1 hypothetical protein TH53_18795 [Pedobacter lusitanus]